MNALMLVTPLLAALSATEPVPAPAPATAMAAAPAAPAAATAAAPKAGSSIAIAEDELAGEDEAAGATRDGWGAEKGARTGGAVGIVLGVYRPSMAGINKVAAQLNFPGGFGSDALFMSGIRGYGYVGRHFRIGGQVLSGSASIADPGAAFDRELDLNVSQGGITLEYVYPTQRMEFYAGGLVGVGSVELTYRQQDLRDRKFDWASLTNTYSGTPNTGTYDKTLSAGYTVVNPWIGAKYKLLPWFAIDGVLGYHLGGSAKGDWSFSDYTRFGIKNSPALDMAGLTGSLQVTFGFFPY